MDNDETKDVAEQASTAVSLPSPNIQHSSVLENELTNRLHQFESGKIALQGELEGAEQTYRKEADERAAKHEEAKGDLLRRIADMDLGIQMLSAGLDAKIAKR